MGMCVIRRLIALNKDGFALRNRNTGRLTKALNPKGAKFGKDSAALCTKLDLGTQDIDRWLSLYANWSQQQRCGKSDADGSFWIFKHYPASLQATAS
jgi:hypothetical protein